VKRAGKDKLERNSNKGGVQTSCANPESSKKRVTMVLRRRQSVGAGSQTLMSLTHIAHCCSISLNAAAIAGSCCRAARVTKLNWVGTVMPSTMVSA
jgi:hypothetical protein